MVVKCLNDASGSDWAAYHGDSCDVLPQLPSESMGLSVFSIPFSNLFCYSDSEADLGNSADDAEFLTHYAFIARELARVTKPGRLCVVHCSDLPLQKWRDGVIGIKDLCGDVIRVHQAAGWTLHSRVTIWKDPVVEMTRTKALGLLYKQLQSDSSRSRQGMPDYLLVFRAPGVNVEPIGHKPENFSLDQWQKWASPVWMDIRQTNTLNAATAKDSRDERHLCPLQLDLIERAIIMWSNYGDVVLSPFMGIGSEGFVALRNRRRFVGIELKDTYWSQACRNLASSEAGSAGLFDAAYTSAA